MGPTVRPAALSRGTIVVIPRGDCFVLLLPQNLVGGEAHLEPRAAPVSNAEWEEGRRLLGGGSGVSWVWVLCQQYLGLHLPPLPEVTGKGGAVAAAPELRLCLGGRGKKSVDDVLSKPSWQCEILSRSNLAKAVHGERCLGRAVTEITSFFPKVPREIILNPGTNLSIPWAW